MPTGSEEVASLYHVHNIQVATFDYSRTGLHKMLQLVYVLTTGDLGYIEVNEHIFDDLI